MTSSKRDFTDFKAFPGKVDANSHYVFPTLWHKDSYGHLRQWTVRVRLIHDTNTTILGIDWDLSTEKQVNIKDSYFINDQLPEGIIAEVWVENGVSGGKITRSSPTYIKDLSFEGNKNQRNQFQAALIFARSLYLKRQDLGGSIEKPDDKAKKPKKQLGVIKYFPMLAKPYKDGIKHIKFPAYVQPKLDGVRCITYLEKKDGGVESIICYSRKKNPLMGTDHIKQALYYYLNALFDVEKNQSLFLDGELYKHGKRLQDISGEVRNEGENKTADIADKNQYHLYDCFYPLELDTPFEDRKEQLEVIFNSMQERKDITAQSCIKQVKTTLADDLAAATKLFNKYTEAKYEGVILRNTQGVYLADADRGGNILRSNDLVKMKEKFSDEYKIVGYTSGKRGKDKNAVIWIAETPDGKQFNVTPKDMTYEERYKIYDKCVKNFSQYANRMMTIEYEDLSRDGIPQRAKGCEFRDYE